MSRVMQSSRGRSVMARLDGALVSGRSSSSQQRRRRAEMNYYRDRAGWLAGSWLWLAADRRRRTYGSSPALFSAAAPLLNSCDAARSHQPGYLHLHLHLHCHCVASRRAEPHRTPLLAILPSPPPNCMHSCHCPALALVGV